MNRRIFADELKNHIRFTFTAVLIATAVIFIFRTGFITGSLLADPALYFEGFFISHLFFAALTPSALLSIYNKNFLLAVFISILSSSVTCSLSDIVFPYLGGLMLNYDMHFHLCIIEEPLLAWIFIIVGSLSGFLLAKGVMKISRYTHTAHILLSSLAAGTYLIAYGVDFLTYKALLFIPVLIISVLFPCVMNDIGIPSFIVSLTAHPDKKSQMLHDLHHEHHGHEHNQ